MVPVPAQASEADGVLPVGDPRRRAIGRGAFGTLLLSAVFFAFTVPTKQIASIYDHAPWQNDPFDTVYSFAMFVVPLVAACFLVQVSLCRKSEPLAARRAFSVLRGCRVALGAVLVTLLSCWVSVAARANRPQWTGGATVPLIVFLALVTALAAKVTADVLRAPVLRIPAVGDSATRDWLGDAVEVARRESRWFGPMRPAVTRLIGRADRSVVRRLRQHPLLGAMTLSLAFGLVVGVNQGVRERYFPAATLITAGLLSCGMFAFLALAGSYLGIASGGTALHGTRRRAVDAVVAACTAAVVSLGFRNFLWWIVGTSQAAAGTGKLGTLLGVTSLIVFSGVFGAESLMRWHSAAHASGPGITGRWAR